MAQERKVVDKDASLLSPTAYDDDASSMHSDQEDDSEDDDVLGTRTSGEIRHHDQGILMEEEERERMLRSSRETAKGTFVPNAFRSVLDKAYAVMPGRVGQDYHEKQDQTSNDRQRRAGRRKRRDEKKKRLSDNASHGEDGELMYEMEGGGIKDGSSTGESSDTEDSSVRDRRRMNQVGESRREKSKSWRNWLLVHTMVAILFVGLAGDAWHLSKRQSKSSAQLFNNGTALFAPTTILISLDGFRADFLNRDITPRLSAFIAEGVSPSYMLPSFPSVTFPNHYTIVTGLYPESHGVVGNTFWDPVLEQEFFYTDPLRSMQGQWWGGEPIWVTAEKQGIRTAIHMWPGSEAHIMTPGPSFVDKYNGKELLSAKVDRVLGLLDLPGRENENVSLQQMRPQLIAAYVPNVDVDGHKFGPNSTEIRTTINNVDTMMNQLFMGLEERNLTHVVNVIVVSDHGMATTSTDRLIQLEDLIDMSLIDHVDGWPLYGLRLKDESILQEVYEQLSQAAKDEASYDVYLRDVNMPERYHFSKNDRIAPLWIVPKTGWAIVTKEEFDVQAEKVAGGVYHPRGLHGYDFEHPLMRAIFIARGPAFPHEPNSRIEVFQNTEVYNIVCDTLGLEPQPNNGTLRLPLRPVGTHDNSTKPDDPDDLPASTTTDELIDFNPDLVMSISPVEASSAADPNLQPPDLVGVDAPDIDDVDVINEPDSDGLGGSPDHLSSDAPEVDASSAADGEEDSTSKSFWDYFVGQLEDLKDWAENLVHGKQRDGGIRR